MKGYLENVGFIPNFDEVLEAENFPEVQACDFVSRKVKVSRAEGRKHAYRVARRRACMLRSCYTLVDVDYYPLGKLRKGDPVIRVRKGKDAGKEIRRIHGYTWRHQREDLYYGIVGTRAVYDYDCDDCEDCE